MLGLHLGNFGQEEFPPTAAQVSRIIDFAGAQARQAIAAVRRVPKPSDLYFVIDAVKRAIARNGVGGAITMGVGAPVLATGSAEDYPQYDFRATRVRAAWKKSWPVVKDALAAGDAFVMSVSFPRLSSMGPLPSEAIAVLNQMLGYYAAVDPGASPPALSVRALESAARGEELPIDFMLFPPFEGEQPIEMPGFPEVPPAYAAPYEPVPTYATPAITSTVGPAVWPSVTPVAPPTYATPGLSPLQWWEQPTAFSTKPTAASLPPGIFGLGFFYRSVR